MRETDPSLTKISPHNHEAEQVVLASMLMENKCIPEVQKTLHDKLFYAEAHRKIFSAIVEMSKQGEVDLIVLSNELRRINQLESVGGSAYIASLVDNLPSAALAGQYAGIVKQKGLLRQVISASSEIMGLAYDDREPLEAILTKWQSLFSDLLKQSAEGESSQKLRLSLEYLKGYFSSCRETPYELLNRALGGLFGGEMIIVGARPGMGKTAFVHGLLRHTAIQENRPSLYFGAEMSREIIYARMLSAMCQIPYNHLKRGRINNEQVNTLLAAHQKIDAAPINEYIIKDKISAISLIAQIRRFADDSKEEVGLVIVENLQQITWPEKKFKTRKEEIDIILESLKPFGIEMKIPIVISCQINRDPEEREDKRPMLSDLKDTGQVEEIVEKVIFPFRPNYYEKKPVVGPEAAELIVAKGGPPITIPMKFFGEYLCWEEAAE